jgi:hypothetical protein
VERFNEKVRGSSFLASSLEYSKSAIESSGLTIKTWRAELSNRKSRIAMEGTSAEGLRVSASNQSRSGATSWRLSFEVSFELQTRILGKI